MKERLHRILNIKISESSQVFDLLIVQFFMGLAIAFLNIVAFSLFVYSFPVQMLPVVYLAIAVMMVVCNIGYEKMEHKLTPPQLLKVIIGVSGLLLVMIWIGLSFGNKHDFIFILLMTNTLVYMITGFAFWGLVSLLFNVRESRRVFSVVGAGDIPAKLIGYLVAPLLIALVGLVHLIWFAVIFLLLSLFIFHRVIRKKSWEVIRKKAHAHAEEHHEVAAVKQTDLVNFFFKDKLIFTISLLSILSYNVFVLVDYTFISQVKIRFENVADLSIYVATFFAIGRLVAVVFKLLFTSKLIERLGIINCLFITPLILLMSCILFLWYGDDSHTNIYIFGAMAMLTEVLRSTMQEPVFFILFQPLKEQLRLKGHIITKGYMLPPSLIIVGSSLLFLYNTGTPITILFTVKIILLNLVIWAVIIVFVQRSYLKTLHASIRKGILNSDDVFISDQKGIDMLLSKVNTGKKIEVIYALNLLEKAEYTDIDKLMLQQLSVDKDPEIKKYVIDQISKKGTANTGLFKKLLEHETDEEVQHKLVAFLCRHDEEFLGQLSEAISDQNSEIKRIIIINLLNQQEFNYLFKAGNELNGLINSPDPKERELAINIISEVKHVQFSGVIGTLIKDEEMPVRRKAITAACKLKLKSLLPSIFEIAKQPSDKYLVLYALQTYGDALFQDIHSLDKEVLSAHTNDLIKISGKIRGQYSTQFLLSAADAGLGLPYNIVHALWDKEYEPVTQEETTRLRTMLNNYLRTGSSKINDYNGVPFVKKREMLRDSIKNEVKGDLVSALKLCVLLFKKKEINRVLELVQIEGNVKVFNAMEMLELMLPQKISKDINQLFDFVLDPTHRKVVTENYKLEVLFQKVFYTEAFTFNPWTKAVCIYCSWINHDVGLLKKISNGIGSQDQFIIAETRSYVLNNIN
jgi:ATP/ADP translocase